VRRKYVYLLLGLAVLVGGAIVGVREFYAAAEAFQLDADIVRLRHLQYYAGLIEEFHAKTGQAPLQGRSKLPVYVHIANNEQLRSAKGGPPYPHVVVPLADFVKELEQALGRRIDEYYDPQLGPLHKPNFYLYMVRGDAWFLAVHVHQPYSFAKRIAEHYYKIEVSNVASAQNKAWSLHELFTSDAFRAAVAKPLTKPAFFQSREAAHLHDAVRANGS
jgi:hypothetical protein